MSVVAAYRWNSVKLSSLYYDGIIISKLMRHWFHAEATLSLYFIRHFIIIEEIDFILVYGHACHLYWLMKAAPFHTFTSSIFRFKASIYLISTFRHAVSPILFGGKVVAAHIDFILSFFIFRFFIIQGQGYFDYFQCCTTFFIDNSMWLCIMLLLFDMVSSWYGCSASSTRSFKPRFCEIIK